MHNAPRKIVLAYSGGLDTSTVLKWLTERYEAEIIAFCGDLGQTVDLAAVEDRARRAGASKTCVKDLRREFIESYAFRCLKAGALYQGKYPMSSSMSRPLLAKELIAISRQEGADAIAHGCSGKGNDQLRFAASAMALEPGVTLLSPLIDWPLRSRDEQVEYAGKHGIEVPVTAAAPYSLDENLWGRSIGCGPLEDLSQPLAEEIFRFTCAAREAPEDPQRIEIGFEQGVPTTLDGRQHDAVSLVQSLNRLAGAHGVGRIEQIKDKVVGIKAREVYECPAAVVLYRAHTDLEELTLDKATLDFNRITASQYAELTYAGFWFSPLKQALDSFVEHSQRSVSGTVTVELYRGSCRVVGRASDNALYDYALSTYDRRDAFDHQAGQGFTQIMSLPQRVVSMVRGGATA